MDHNGFDRCSSDQLNAEGEIAVARLLLDSGDIAHALRHLTDALALAPRLPDVHEALSEIVARAGGAELALGYLESAEGGEIFIGTVAARAHILAMAGRLNEAVEMLLEITAHVPTRPWLDVAWLQRADLPDLVRPETIIHAAAQLAIRLDDPVDENKRLPLLPILTLLRVCIARHPRHATLLWCGSMVARKLGAFDDALKWADRSFSVEPSHEAAAMKGYALQSAGRNEEALIVWLQEVQRAPGNVEMYLDIADLHQVMRRPEGGLIWGRRAVALDPENQRTIATMHGLGYAVDRDARHLVALADQVRAQPDSYAGGVLARHSHDRPWLGTIPWPVEAVTTMLLKFLESDKPVSDSLHVVMSALEPPSATLALRLAFPKTMVDIKSVPEPDIRLPLRPVQLFVWKYSGTEASPAGPPPSLEVAEVVREVATVRWRSPLAAYDRAIALSGLDPWDLVAVLVHPPAPPENEFGRDLAERAPFLWVRAVQVWACLGIAHHRSDEPWLSSRRREILADLLDGPEDWVTEAAAFALVVTAWVNPSAREDVLALIVNRLFAALDAAGQREVIILDSLCELVLLLPQLDDQVSALAREVLAARAAE